MSNPIKELYVPFKTFVEQALYVEDDNIAKAITDLFIRFPEEIQNRYMMKYPYKQSYLSVCATLDNSCDKETFPKSPLFEISEEKDDDPVDIQFSLNIGTDEVHSYFVKSTFIDNPIKIAQMQHFTISEYLLRRFLPFFNTSLSQEVYQEFLETADKNNMSVLVNDMRNAGILIDRTHGFTLTSQPNLDKSYTYKIFILTDGSYEPICDVGINHDVGKVMGEINQRILKSFDNKDKIIYSTDWIEY